MKRYCFILALVAVILASCSQVERKEKKYVNSMKSSDYEEATQAFDEFCNWVLKDHSTMTHDFKLMREEMDLNIAASKDGNLRCYSWPTNVGNGVKVYANIVQWKSGEHYGGFAGPIDQLLAGRKADIKRHRSMSHSIDTIYQLNNTKPTVYLIEQSYTTVNGKRRAYVSATCIDGLVLRLLPFFFDGIEIAGNYEFYAKGKVNDLFKWDEQTGRFYAYQTDDNDKVIPGKYIVYQLSGDRFTRVPEDNNN